MIGKLEEGLPEFQNWPDSLDSDINKKPNHPLYSKMVVFGEGEERWGGNLVEGWNRKEYSVMKTQYEERKNRFRKSVDSLQKEILSLFSSSSSCSSSSSTTLSSSSSPSSPSSPPPLPSSSPLPSSNLLGESLSSEEKERVRLSWDHFAQRFSSYNPPHSPQLEQSYDSHFHVFWLDFFLQVLVEGAFVEREEKTLEASVKSNDAGKGVSDACFGKKVDMITTIGSLEYLAHESANEEFDSAKGEKDSFKLMKEMHDMLCRLENDVKPLKTDGPWETWGIQTGKFGVKVYLLRGTHSQVSQVCLLHSFDLFSCESTGALTRRPSEWGRTLSEALAVGVVLCRELNNLHERRMKAKEEKFDRGKMRGSQRKTSSGVPKQPPQPGTKQLACSSLHDQGVLIGNKMLESLYEEEGFDIISGNILQQNFFYYYFFISFLCLIGFCVEGKYLLFVVVCWCSVGFFHFFPTIFFWGLPNSFAFWIHLPSPLSPSPSLSLPLSPKKMELENQQLFRLVGIDEQKNLLS